MTSTTLNAGSPAPAANRKTDTTALMLMTYGTPTGPEAVEPYLFNIFNDPDIIPFPWYMTPFRSMLARKIAKARREEVIENYAKLGGTSPLLDLTIEQGDALVRALKTDGSFESFMGMRYWAPRTPDTLREIVSRGIRSIVLLPMYPHYAGATTGSSINDFKRAARDLGVTDLDVRAICCFPDNPKMVAAMARSIEKAMAGIPEGERRSTPLLFSAHGLPQKSVDMGDPYAEQVGRTVKAVVAEMGGHDAATLCYQSRVGKMEWIKPYADHVLEDLVAKKVKRIVVYPVAFVTEHSETLFELDMLYGDMVRAAGIEYIRVPALGTDPLFIEALADEVRQAVSGPPLRLK